MPFSRLASLWRNLRNGGRVERDLDDEMQSTLGLLIDEKIAAGVEPREARRRSLIEMNGIEPVKERVRDVRMGMVIDTLFQDFKHAIRHFRRSPGFAFSAIVTLAIGIGANTAMFSVLNALVFKRLAIPAPDGLISLTVVNERGDQRYIPFPAVDTFGATGPFRSICGYNGGGVSTVVVNGTPAMALFASISGGCFDAFGVRPMLGRPILPSDAPLVAPGQKVVVISHRFWTRMFGADPAVLGKMLRIETTELTVVGVTPEGFGGLHVDTAVDLFMAPGTVFPWNPTRRPVASEVVGRLRDGVTIDQAAAQLAALWPQVKAASGDLSQSLEGAALYGDITRVQSIGTGISSLRGRYTQSFTLMAALTALLLVLMCVNVGGLLLTRLSARSNELAVRLALGGSRYRVAQQMLIEGLLLSLAGTLVAIPLAFAVITPIVSLMPQTRIARTIAFTPDSTVLAAMALVGLFAGVMITAVPVWLAIRRQVGSPFTWDRTMAPATSWWSRSLLVSQVAVSVVILIGAALLVRSLYLLQRVDTGVKSANLIDVDTFPLPGGTDREDTGTYYRAIIDRLAELPGVQSVGMSQLFPRHRNPPVTPVAFVGDAENSVPGITNTVSPTFFDTVGVRLLAGRHFTWDDTGDTMKVCIVSESLAKALRPDGDVLQRRIRYGAYRDRQDLTIVGIVSNMSLGSLREETPPIVFVPLLESGTNFNAPNILISTTRSIGSVATAVRGVLADGGREYAREIISVDDLFARSPSGERLSATLAAITGGLALLLAVIGIHGVLAYSVARRTREIGVRIAVGADPRSVAWGVVREAGRLTLIGLAIGVPMAFLASRALRSLLFGISDSDIPTFGIVALVLLLVGLAAGVGPARRAIKIDPVIALRTE